jgi:next-to-BRCA1 protein 1
VLSHFCTALGAYTTITQFNRVFRINNPYYLSRLTFSTNPDTLSRIQLPGLVRSQDDYNKFLVIPLQGWVWQNAVLKLCIVDAFAALHSTSVDIGSIPIYDNTSDRYSQNNPVASVNDDRSSSPLSPPIISPFLPPSPPIFLRSSTPSPTDMGHILPTRSSSIVTDPTVGAHQQDDFSQRRTSFASSSCCNVSEGKLEIQRLMESFKSDLERVMTSTFGSPSPGSLPSLPDLKTSAPAPSATHIQWFCVTCLNLIHGSWFACKQCPGHVMVCRPFVGFYSV